MTARRVVITGMGVVTPLGNDLDTTIAGLLEGRSGFDPAVPCTSAPFGEICSAAVKGFDPRDHFRLPKAIKITDRAAQFAVAAAAMAIDDAGWPDGERMEGVGVAIGSSGSDLQPDQLARAIGSDPDRRVVHDMEAFGERMLGGLHPLWLLVSLPNMVSAHVAIQLGARGPNTTIMTDWIAGTQAIGEAFDWIRRGDAEAVLAGGADSGLYPFAFGSYEQGGLFDGDGGADARRFVPGEGAALLLLEDRARAIERGARVLGEIAGYATASAPVDAAAASDGGALACTMRAALDDAGWPAASIDRVVNATVFDARYVDVERAACRHALASSGVCTMEFTSRLGHALAAAGPIDAAIALMLAARSAGDRPCRIVCNTLGYSGQAASITVFGGNR